MLKKVKCSNCGEETTINTSIPHEDLKNILCECCAKGTKEECDEKANKNR